MLRAARVSGRLLRRVASRLVGWALVPLFLVAPGSAAGDGPSLESTVVFGTTCARCHEGECSGRLTFSLGADAATGHVRRHAGDVSDDSVRELIALLETMKEECAYPPLDVAVPPDHEWTAGLLERLCIPSGRSCLVPLGRLEPGIWRVEMQLSGADHVHAEVVTRTFEMLLEEALTIEAGASAIAFRAAAPVEPFLRLVAQERLRVTRVRLEKVDAPGEGAERAGP